MHWFIFFFLNSCIASSDLAETEKNWNVKSKLINKVQILKRVLIQFQERFPHNCVKTNMYYEEKHRKESPISTSWQHPSRAISRNKLLFF
jgi:hypothetical protein